MDFITNLTIDQYADKIENDTIGLDRQRAYFLYEWLENTIGGAVPKIYTDGIALMQDFAIVARDDAADLQDATGGNDGTYTFDYDQADTHDIVESITEYINENADGNIEYYNDNYILIRRQ